MFAKLFKPSVFILSLLPALWLGYAVWQTQQGLDVLGANPVEALQRKTGEWALIFLCLVLSVTPLRKITGWHSLARVRRMLGLYVFFYALLHFAIYALDSGFVWADIVADVIKRPFITVGMLGFILLWPLALTSFNAAIRWLGGKRWQQLHKLVYAIAILGVLHFVWHKAGKNDFIEPIKYGVIVAGLLGWRVWQRMKSRARD